MEAGGETADPGQPAAAPLESPETDASPSEPRPPTGVVLLAGLGMACLLGFAGLLWYCGSLPLLHEPRIGALHPGEESWAFAEVRWAVDGEVRTGT